MIKAGARLGKTQAINNIIGYHMHIDPSPMMMVLPKEGLVEEWSKNEFAPMIRDTEVLRNLLTSDNVMQKDFPGGRLICAYASSADQFRARTVRLFAGDEIDAWPLDVGGEGSPIALGMNRTTTFGWRRKHVLTSTPTIKGVSAIEDWYEKSDQRHYLIPCPYPECNELQELKWMYVDWDKDSKGNHLPETVRYFCSKCGCAFREVEKNRSIKKGIWVPEKPASSTAGFFINSLYSPWLPMEEMVNEFILAQGDATRMKAWVNTRLGEAWVGDQEDTIEPHALMQRLETYGPDLPMDSLILTGGADVQKDRIELGLYAWSQDHEAWAISHQRLMGDPMDAGVWHELWQMLNRDYRHETGHNLMLARTCIDTGGMHTDKVYEFCAAAQREGLNVIPIKGHNIPDAPMIPSKGTVIDRYGIQLYTIGVNKIKSHIAYMLTQEQPGPHYVHFRAGIHTIDYFEGLTSEKRVIKMQRGIANETWVKRREHVRNEPWDCFVYAFAALNLARPDWAAIREYLGIPDPYHQAGDTAA